MATSEQTVRDESCLCFRTQGEWTATDVVALMSGVSGIYDAFLSVGIQRRREDEQFRRMERSLERFHKHMDHPMCEEFYMMWLDYMRMWRKERVFMPYPPPFLFPTPFPQQPYEQEPSAFDIFSEIESFVPSEKRLRIRRIEMASPGSFNLSGSGEIVREIRELIKDLWFRNRQEKAKGELDIIDKYLTMRRENSDLNLPPPAGIGNRKLVKTVQERIHLLRWLERDGKLLSVPEHIEAEKE
jgi:hypothetical protein